MITYQDISNDDMSRVLSRGVATPNTTELHSSVSRRESTSSMPDGKMKAANIPPLLKKELQPSSSTYGTCQLSLASLDIGQKPIVVENEKEENDGIAFERLNQIEQLDLAENASIGPSRRTEDLDNLTDEVRAQGRNILQRHDLSFNLEQNHLGKMRSKSDIHHHFTQIKGSEQDEKRHQEEYDLSHQSEKEIRIESRNDRAIALQQRDIEAESGSPTVNIPQAITEERTKKRSSHRETTDDMTVKKNLINNLERATIREGRETDQILKLSRSSSSESKRIDFLKKDNNEMSLPNSDDNEMENNARIPRRILERESKSFIVRKNSLTGIEGEVLCKANLHSQQLLANEKENGHNIGIASLKPSDTQAENVAELQSRVSSFSSRRSSCKSHPIDAIEPSLDKMEDGALKISAHSSSDRAKIEATRLNRIAANNSLHGNSWHGRTSTPDRNYPPRNLSLPVPDSCRINNTKESIGVPPGSLAPGAYRARFYDSDDVEEVEITDFADDSESGDEQDQALAEASLDHSQNLSENESSLQSFASEESSTQHIEAIPVVFHSVPTRSNANDQSAAARICSPTTMLKERKWRFAAMFICFLVFGIALAVPIVVSQVGESQMNASDYVTAANYHICPEHNSIMKFQEQCQKGGKIVQISKCASNLYVLLQEHLQVNIGPSTGVCKAERLALLSMIVYKQNPSISNYALSTLYFSTDGNLSWKRKKGWLTSKNVCTWEGIQCKTVLDDSPAQQPSLNADDRIEKIELANNTLIGSIPTHLGMLNTLETLNLSMNGLRDSIPMEIGKIKNLNELDLSQNSHVDGTIPTTVSLLRDLKVLVLSGMKLSGSIPSQIGEMKSLERLLLSSNRLSHLPSEIGNLENLKDLWCDNNKLQGKMPVELGKCTNLHSLIMGGNSFSGEIPIEIGLLTHLSKYIKSYPCSTESFMA